MITSQDVSSATSPLPRGVRRALDAMRANVGHNWRLTELAAIAGTSGRTLQRQFLSFVGKTPRAVLRDIGLECARRELLQGAPGVTIMDVALRCGFPHCGRFSIAYRRRYGETPSQTLKRQAVFTAIARRHAFAVRVAARSARGGVWTDRIGHGTSGDCSRYRRRSRRRTDPRRNFGGRSDEGGTLSFGRCDQGIGFAGPPDLTADRHGNGLPALGASLRQYPARRNCRRGTPRHQDRCVASAMPAAGRDRSRVA